MSSQYAHLRSHDSGKYFLTSKPNGSSSIRQSWGTSAARRRLLGQGATSKQITVCQDKTFHPDTCLVAIEPVSNYILLEKYAENRKAETWTQSMARCTQRRRRRGCRSNSSNRPMMKAEASAIMWRKTWASIIPQMSSICNKMWGTEVGWSWPTENVIKPAGPPDGAAALVQPWVTAQAQEQKAREAWETITGQQKRVQEAVAGISTALLPVRFGDQRGPE